MSQQPPLPAEVEARLAEIGEVDLLIGIPSYNNSKTIGHVVEAATAGLAKYFPDRSSVIVNSDGGSSDGTAEVVRQSGIQSLRAILVSHRLSPVHKIITPYHGIPGKGSAFRTIFAIATRLRAKACAVVDSDLRSIAPEWIELLLAPILRDEFDFVAPLYLRHKYDGTITNSIVYPLTRALYGQDVRQPIGGDFGFSGRLAAHYLAKPVWETNVARFGIDIWMTTTAIADGFKICQSFLGAKIHDAKDPGSDLSQMFIQVVSSVFELMAANHRSWATPRPTEEVPLFGFPHGVGLEPVAVDLQRMLRLFRLATRDLSSVWRRFASERSLDALATCAAMPDDAFELADETWVRIVHEAALGFRRRVLPGDQLLGSLVPIYLGRTASFVRRTAEADAPEVEGLIRALADEFVRQKPSLIEGWR